HGPVRACEAAPEDQGQCQGVHVLLLMYVCVADPLLARTTYGLHAFCLGVDGC
uniref:Uncharacterized protein n=1 Tax=Aegilops tauschii subsp. strangulata TaxID=200361 RepID=A0A453H2Z4_AEGTS